MRVDVVEFDETENVTFPVPAGGSVPEPPDVTEIHAGPTIVVYGQPGAAAMPTDPEPPPEGIVVPGEPRIGVHAAPD